MNRQDQHIPIGEISVITLHLKSTEASSIKNTERFNYTMSSYVVVGAGVIGLTTALELKDRYPSANVTIAAKYLPGDSFADYASNWGGANWFPASADNGRQEKWDSITYKKFKHLSRVRPDSGVKAMNIRFHYDRPIEEVGILTPSTGKVWFEDLVGGLKPIEKDNLPSGAAFGFEMASFVLDTQRYLPWLQMEAHSRGIEIHRKIFIDIREVFNLYPGASAVFNCTGLGSLTLGGVEDKMLYPARGQILLVEGPKEPIPTMYFQAPHRDADATHIFPRGNDGMGGVILGGCRQKNNWDGEVDLEFAEVIKRKCCALVPRLGKLENLKIIKHGVGLRPSRKGGARVEREYIDGKLVIHNYGAGGTGFQASWGLALEAVDLIPERARL
ncbi:putative D-amino acid oxidase [Aspergillus sergii]|uniref:Putative D-amino acid oxidase n=1 Tax=Aspergillus sergii TaxID=1034303 RepID=A0A5N6WWF5_9EURO|nr:putative D-amino acid oxidase [Aspergillus sergii]